MKRIELPAALVADLLRRTRKEVRGEGATIHLLLKQAVFGERNPNDRVIATYPQWMMVVRATPDEETNLKLLHHLQQLSMERNFAETPEEIAKVVEEYSWVPWTQSRPQEKGDYQVKITREGEEKTMNGWYNPGSGHWMVNGKECGFHRLIHPDGGEEWEITHWKKP